MTSLFGSVVWKCLKDLAPVERFRVTFMGLRNDGAPTIKGRICGARGNGGSLNYISQYCLHMEVLPAAAPPAPIKRTQLLHRGDHLWMQRDLREPIYISGHFLLPLPAPPALIKCHQLLTHPDMCRAKTGPRRVHLCPSMADQG
ncbi:hypothetical protein NDU88_001622 [Pleurodeles waltl]|uniref:Uncharacterized protein n=1 Tax=Pleurodeles waltl TaxID=8319 RepID=A0AAV7U6Z2_PLEWA|nr:hypothetical protein NDU88_001622 [Pleurodeles waltl]